jgi:UDP-glucose 4-epimerase
MRDTSKSTLILGGEGFIGSHLVERIPNSIPVDDRSYHKHEFAKTVVMDISSPGIDELIAGAGLVIHAACRDIRNSMSKPLEDAQTNILGTLNVLIACRRHQVPCFYISSVSVEHEVSHYAVSKSAGERYTMMYRQWVPTAMVRLSNVFGPRDTESVVARWLRDEEITLIAENATRDFTYIEDTVAGILKAIEAWPASVVSIGTGVETPLGQLAEWISKRMEKPVRKIAAREIDNVIRRVVDPAEAERRIGFRANWGIFNGLEDYIRKYDRPARMRA